MMDRHIIQSSSRLLTTWNICVASCLILLCARVSSSSLIKLTDEKAETRESRNMFTGMTPSPITRIQRISNGRLNSRFLRTFPSLNFLQVARRDGQLIPESPSVARQHFVNGNSPVFYIRLPPVPYMFVPGLGYVSPHPYNTPMIGAPPATPVMMNPLGMVMGSGTHHDNYDLSSENSNNNVISLPLKFLSNGRPAQIQNPKKPSKSKPIPSFKPDSSMTTHLISGGKYSFNGRPNGVFIVRSPIIDSSSPNAL